jgi:hypothetical protein
VLITSTDTITGVWEATEEVDQRAGMEKEATGRGSGRFEIIGLVVVTELDV